MFSQSVNRVIPTSLCKLKSVCHKQIYPLKDVKDFLTFPIREKKKKLVLGLCGMEERRQTLETDRNGSRFYSDTY